MQRRQRVGVKSQFQKTFEELEPATRKCRKRNNLPNTTIPIKEQFNSTSQEKHQKEIIQKESLKHMLAKDSVNFKKDTKDIYNHKELQTTRVKEQIFNTIQTQDYVITDKKEPKLEDEQDYILTKQKQIFQIPYLSFPQLKGKKRPWSEQEDDMLIKLVQLHGPQKWTFIAEHLPGRIGKQCRERWHNHLNPRIKKSHWHDHEEWVLFLSHRVMGNRWAEMAKYLLGRTDNSIKNHWNSAMKKRIPELEERLKTIRKRGGIVSSDLSSQFTQLERQFITKLLSQPQGQNPCPSPQVVPRRRQTHKLVANVGQNLDSQSVTNYLGRLIGDIKVEGLPLGLMARRMWKRQSKIASSVFWTMADDIDQNLYDYILDKIGENNEIDDPDKAVDRWIKGFWIMCQEVFTVSTIKEYLEYKPSFTQQYFPRYSNNTSSVEPKNLTRLYEEDNFEMKHCDEHYSLPHITFKTPLKQKNVQEVHNNNISPNQQLKYSDKQSHEKGNNNNNQFCEQNYESPSKLLNLQTPNCKRDSVKRSDHKTPRMSLTPYTKFSNRQTSSFKVFQRE